MRLWNFFHSYTWHEVIHLSLLFAEFGLVSLRCNVLIEIIPPFSIPQSKLCCCRSFIWWDWNLSSKSIQMEISDNRRPKLHTTFTSQSRYHLHHFPLRTLNLILTKLKSCELDEIKNLSNHGSLNLLDMKTVENTQSRQSFISYLSALHCYAARNTQMHWERISICVVGVVGPCVSTVSSQSEYYILLHL